MNLQEQISRIQSMMGLLNEETKVSSEFKNLSGYDMSKIKYPENTMNNIGTYPYVYMSGDTPNFAVLYKEKVYMSTNDKTSKSFYVYSKEDFEQGLNSEFGPTHETIIYIGDKKNEILYNTIADKVERTRKEYNRIMIEENLNSTKIELNSVLGNVIVLDFWASWCGPCKTNFSTKINELYNLYSSKGVKFFNYCVDLDLLKSKTALDDFGINYAINVIGENYESIKQTTTNFEVTQFPKTIVLGKDGKIAAVNLQSLEDYKSMIDSLLV